MRDVLTTVASWTEAGSGVALGTIVERVGSAPRDAGAALAVSTAGELAGSVTGGCVDPAVIKAARDVLAGDHARLLVYGLADEDTVGVGLACGGTIAVAVHALDARLVPRLADAVATDRPVALTLRLDDGGFGDQRLLALGDDDAVDALLDLGESGIVENRNGEVVFVESFAPRPNLYVFGASDHVAALARAGRFLGYRVTVCDARGSLLARGRFPDADEVVAEWPDRFLERAAVDARTAICVLTHDDKFDVPALKRALESP